MVGNRQGWDSPILVVDTPKEQRVKANLCREQGSLCGGVTKGIDLPTDARNSAKLLEQQAMAHGGLIDHANVVRVGFIVLPVDHGVTSCM